MQNCMVAFFFFNRFFTHSRYLLYSFGVRKTVSASECDSPFFDEMAEAAILCCLLFFPLHNGFAESFFGVKFKRFGHVLDIPDRLDNSYHV